MLPSTTNDAEATTMAALYALDVFDLDTAARFSGATPEELEALLTSPAVETECLRLQADNQVTELRAAFGLDTVVERLVAGIEEIDSQSGLIRTGEFLHRISGLQERRAAAAKAGTPEKPQFSFHIALQNDDGTTRTINIGGGEQ